ncbi:MAG: MOSC domain-containing protein [Caldilineaceae bacterium]
MKPIIIHSIYIGQPQTLSDAKGEWRSSIFRTLVDGPIELGERGLAGDRVTDTKHHGAAFQAVCCHSMDHYAFWNSHFEIAESEKALSSGSVGENWTLLNADEGAICVGDIYAVGAARVQVSGPRYPCAKQERKVGLKGFTKRSKEMLRTGFYLSTLTAGTVEAGNKWVLETRPNPDVPLRLVNETAFLTKDANAVRRLLDTPELNDGWKRMLRRLPKR